MADKEPTSKEAPTSTKQPMDPKKKHILIGAGAFGVIVLVYLWYKNSSSSSTATTTTPSGSGITSYIPSGGGSGGSPSITNTFNPVNTFTNTPSNSNANTAYGGMGGGTSTSLLPITSPAKKGGKTQIHHAITKGGVKASGGNGKVSTTTATQRTMNIRAANQRKIANQKAANQRRVTNRQHAATMKHVNHVSPPSHSFTSGHTFNTHAFYRG